MSQQSLFAPGSANREEPIQVRLLARATDPATSKQAAQRVVESGRLTIDETCVESVAEFDVYRWAKRKDQTGESFATSTPDWTHADLMDARRYAVMAVVDGIPVRKRNVPVVRRGSQASRV